MNRLWSLFLGLLSACLVLAITLMSVRQGAAAASPVPLDAANHSAAPTEAPHLAPDTPTSPCPNQGWTQANVNGFGSADNIHVSALEYYFGQLYAGTWNDAGVQLWRAENDFSAWNPVASTWSLSNTAVTDMEVFAGQLYVGTSAPTGGELWRYTFSTGSWQQVVFGGFGSSDNGALENVADFSGALFVATTSSSGTHQLWRSVSGDPGSWTQVAALGGPGRMEELAGQLYLGMGGQAGGELWRSADGLAWTPVFTDGLAAGNTHVAAMAEFNGAIYVGFRNPTNGGQVWRSDNGLAWTPVVTAGLGSPDNSRAFGLVSTADYLYLTFTNLVSGAEVWRMAADGAWNMIACGGWDKGADNGIAAYFDKSIAVSMLEDHLHVGTHNIAGGEIWHFDPAAAPPAVTALTPNSAPNDADTAVTITGQNFADGIVAWLGSTPLQAVTRVSASQLTATVPWGMSPAVYTLTVKNPDGSTAVLPDAFNVTPGINLWTYGGPYGGEIGSLTLNPVTPTTLYAAAWGSGLFVSRDGAAQWQPAHITPGPERLAVDPHNPLWLYSGSANRCLRSQDGGISWDESCTPASAPTWQYAFSFRPFVHPNIGGRLFLGLSVPDGPADSGRLYRSSDGGSSWLDLTPSLPAADKNVTAVAFDPLNSARIIVGTRDGYIYVSTNGGGAWTQAARPDAHVERLVVNPFGAREVWAVTNGTDWGMHHLWRSTDAALTQWTQNGLDGAASLTFHPTISGTVWAAAGSGLVSANGGATWEPVGAGLLDVLDFAVDPQQPAQLFAGTMRGVFKSADGGLTWTEMNTGLAGVLPNLGLAASPANADEVFAASSGRAFRSINGGRTWEELTAPAVWGARPHMRLLAVDPARPERVYFGDSGAFELHLSEDRGVSWLTASLPQPAGAAHGGGIWAVVPHPTIAGRIFAGAGLYGIPSAYPGALYLSHDYGESWALLNTGPISGVTTIAFDPASPTVGYVATEGGGMLKTVDAGLTWQPLTTWIGGSNVQSIAIHPANHTFFVSTVSVAGQGIYTSADGGLTWARLAVQPTSGPVWELLYSQDTIPILYAGGMESGLSYSTDEGRSWQRVSGLPGSANVPSLASVAVNGRIVLYLGTSGGALDPVRNQAAPARATVMGGGIYRQVRVLPDRQVFLPLVKRP